MLKDNQNMSVPSDTLCHISCFLAEGREKIGIPTTEKRIGASKTALLYNPGGLLYPLCRGSEASTLNLANSEEHHAVTQ